MTFPASESEDELRKQWLNRYLSVQAKTDTKFRTALVDAAEQSLDKISALSKSSMFSAGVRTAQLRLVMQQVQSVHNDLFGKFIPIIIDGQKKSATQAAIAFSSTDRSYLEAAFKNSGHVASYISSQKQQAAAGVVHAISRITKSTKPLSARVYRTKSLANNWVGRQVNAALVRNAGAKEIAMLVRSSIRPNTPGGVSYAAMRLGRTEINNAFHATSVSLAQNRPWVIGMEWHLSNSHIDSHTHTPEICEIYAATKWSVDGVPAKPHPQCRCFVTPQTEELSVFVTHLTAGQYRDWMEQNAA